MSFGRRDPDCRSLCGKYVTIRLGKAQCQSIVSGRRVSRIYRQVMPTLLRRPLRELHLGVTALVRQHIAPFGLGQPGLAQHLQFVDTTHAGQPQQPVSAGPGLWLPVAQLVGHADGIRRQKTIEVTLLCRGGKRFLGHQPGTEIAQGAAAPVKPLAGLKLLRG